MPITASGYSVSIWRAMQHISRQKFTTLYVAPTDAPLYACGVSPIQIAQGVLKINHCHWIQYINEVVFNLIIRNK
jgi:hypothetical protein